MRALGGWGKHIQICLRLAQTALYCASDCYKDTDQVGIIGQMLLLSLVECPCSNANQKLPFLFAPRIPFEMRGVMICATMMASPF